jgi:5'-3' exonuclease
VAALLVVDAPSLLYRAFFALPKSIKGADGRPVNALLGTANLILREVLERRPRAVVLCFGPDAAHYRVELYAPYHAERPPVPDELAPQFADAPGFFSSFGWTSVIDEELEADDVMGSLAQAEERAGGEALLMTGDRDLFQCVTSRVGVLYVRTGVRGTELVDAKEVRRRYGIPPELVPDFIALRGDPSDKLPGAKGVGPKTAASLLGQYGSLEAMLAEGRFSAQADDLRLYKRIASMDAEAPLPDVPDADPDWEGGAKLVRSWGLNALAERLEGRTKSTS